MSSSNGEALQRKLPAGWEWVTLDQVFSTITDGDHAAPPQVSEGVPFLVIGNVRHGFVDFAKVRFVPLDYYEGVGESRKPRQGDLLYTVTGSFGITVVVSSEREFCVQRHIAILKPGSFTSVPYLAFALETSEAYLQAANAATGTAQKTVGLIRLRKFRVPFAPKPEQQRIVEAIESYFTRLDDAVATLERVERNLKRYRASVLKSAVEGRLVPTEAELSKQEGRDYEPADVLLERILKERRRRWEEAELAKMEAKGKPPKNDKWKAKYKEPAAPDATNLTELPEGWCWASLDQVTALVTSGSRGWAKYYSDTGALFIRAQDIKTDSLRIARTAHVTPPPGAEGARTSVQFGDVLVTITGANVTKTAFVSAELGEAYVSQHVGLCRPVDADLAAYLHAWIISPSAGRSQLEAAAYGAGKPGLNLDNLKTLVVALPPVAEQTRLLAEVSRLLSVAEASSSVVVSAGSRARRLRQAILKWAFEGKLADHDPNDESASVLLGRIKAEREAAKPVVKTIRRKGGGKKTIRS